MKLVILHAAIAAMTSYATTALMQESFDPMLWDAKYLFTGSTSAIISAIGGALVGMHRNSKEHDNG